MKISHALLFRESLTVSILMHLTMVYFLSKTVEAPKRGGGFLGTILLYEKIQLEIATC